MGLEHPFLAIIAVSLFIFIAISLTVTLVIIQMRIASLPDIRGYVEFAWDGSNATIYITVFSVKGIATMRYVRVFSDAGYVDLNATNPQASIGNATFTLVMNGFDGQLLTGQKAVMTVYVVNASSVYTKGTKHSVMVAFDVGNLVMYFEP